MSARGFRCVVLCDAAILLVACGGGKGPTISDPTVVVDPPPPITQPPPPLCTVPPLNPIPNPKPTHSYIDSDPTGVCLKNGDTVRVTYTNRGSGSLKFSGFAIVGRDGSGTFDIPANNCQQQLPGRTLFPAGLCTVDVKGTCPGGKTKAHLQANSDAANDPHYKIPVECDP
jgi:hypothetical protein